MGHQVADESAPAEDGAAGAKGGSPSYGGRGAERGGGADVLDVKGSLYDAYEVYMHIHIWVTFFFL